MPWYLPICVTLGCGFPVVFLFVCPAGCGLPWRAGSSDVAHVVQEACILLGEASGWQVRLC